MRASGARYLALAVLAAGIASASGALTIGSPHLTPDMSVLPVYGFRIDLGILSETGVQSLRSGRKGNLWGP